MKLSSRWCLVLVCALSAAVVSAEDWPQWRGMARDGKSPETGLLSVWPAEGPKLLWQAEGVGEGHASMAVVGGRLFTTGMREDTSEGFVSALDLEGKILWQTAYGPEWTGTYPGARSCPTVNEDRVYIASGMARLVCCRADTGEKLWTLDYAEKFAGVPPRVGFAESPLVVDNKVICTPGGENACVVAIEKTSGDTIWRSTGLSDQAAYCSPILVERGGRRLIVTVTARHLVGIDVESGEVVWRAPFDTEAVDPNHSVSPVYEDGRFYVTSGHGEGGSMFQLSEDGARVTPGWTDTVLNCLHGGLVAVDRHLYGTNLGGRWICLDFADGAVKYEDRGVGMGSVIFAEGMLYCYGEKGTLGLVKATPAGYELVSSFKIDAGKGPHWAHPVISGKRLYIRHGNVIQAFGISG